MNADIDSQNKYLLGFFSSFLSVFIFLHIKIMIIKKILIFDHIVFYYSSSFVDLLITGEIPLSLTLTHTHTRLYIICILCRHLNCINVLSALSHANSWQLSFFKMVFVFLLKLYSFSIQMFINVLWYNIHTHRHMTRLNRVVDEKTKGYGLRAKQLGGKGIVCVWQGVGKTTKGKK